MRSRPAAAFAVVAVTIAVVAAGLLVWQPWTGTLEGTVYFTGCGGAEPANPPPDYSPCIKSLSPGAEVSVAAAGGGSMQHVQSDSHAFYEIRLKPGLYYVWATAAKPFRQQGFRTEVLVKARATTRFDVNILFAAA